MNENKQRPMTDEEKEQFLSKVKIECEDYVGTDEPIVIFEKSLNTYQSDMQDQVERLQNLVSVQERLRADAQELYASEELSCTGLDLQTIKNEIATKDKVINGARASIAVMKERIKIGNQIKNKLIKNYKLICDLDFYFNGALNLSETPQRVQRVVEDNVEK